MIKHYIKTQRTARYFLSQEIHSGIKHVLFVLHGYAQNADDFLQSFAPLFKDNTLIVAPEGLSKLYFKDFSNNPASSWMTRLERENELADFYTYMKKVEQEIVNKINGKVDFHVLGFSQGGAMVSRYVADSQLFFKNIFIYASSPAHDLDWHKIPKESQWHLIYGDKDWVVTPERFNEVQQLFKQQNIAISTIKFEGKHEIDKKALEYIMPMVDSK
ncbi:MAG: hypothetical protein KDE33_07650 [Bacteroidetes bacterium]|nr:hypothetical protein [Bacteroidota bacterium]